MGNVFQHHNVALPATRAYHERCVSRFIALRDVGRVSFVLTVTDNAAFGHPRDYGYTRDDFRTLVALLRDEFGINVSKLLVLFFTPTPPPPPSPLADDDDTDVIDLVHVGDGYARVTHALVSPDVEATLRQLFASLS